MMKYLKIFENKESEKKIKYHSNGNIKTISYKLNGKLHREDGPAFQSWFENGNKLQEIYYIKNKKHREDGTALMFYNKNKIISEYYFLNDFKYDKKEWINKLKEIKSPHYEEQKILYNI